MLIEERLAQGDPAANIIAFATEQAVDVVVMGTHGRTGLERVLMGSVATAVLRRAPCPVLFVKSAHANEKPSSDHLRLQAMLENAVDAIITIDATGIILTVNPAATTLFQYSTGNCWGATFVC